MAERVGRDGSVTGIDMDQVKLGLAREAAAARGLTNVEFRSMNIYEWAEPDAYDFVYCRFVLQHLSRPVDVLRNMWAAVRVGGVIAGGRRLRRGVLRPAQRRPRLLGRGLPTRSGATRG